MRNANVGMILVGLEKEALSGVTSPPEIKEKVKSWSRNPILWSYFRAALLDRADRSGRDLPSGLRKILDEELNGELPAEKGADQPEALRQAFRKGLEGAPPLPRDVSEVDYIRIHTELGVGD